jgi:pimeloyl-ACP methyl ester carboxylesterase
MADPIHLRHTVNVGARQHSHASGNRSDSCQIAPRCGQTQRLSNRLRAVTDWREAVSPSGVRFVFHDSGEGPLVVLLHGFPDTPHGWDRISTSLVEAGYRAVRPWLRGYHKDTVVPGRGYDALTISHDPVELLDALGVGQAHALVGHDWGAAITYGAAAVAPERFASFVPIALPHPRVLPRDPLTLVKARHFAGFKMPWAEAMTRLNNFHYIESLYRRWAPRWSGPSRDACLAHAKACFADPVALTGAIDYYRALRPTPPPELRRVPQVRTLVVGGTDDLVPAPLFAKTAELMGDRSRALIVDGAGHWPHREREDDFIEALLGLLAG